MHHDARSIKPFPTLVTQIFKFVLAVEVLD